MVGLADALRIIGSFWLAVPAMVGLLVHPKVEAAAVMPLGNTLGVIEVSKASILRLDDREKTIAAQIIAMLVRPPIRPPIIAGVLLEGTVSAQYLVLFDTSVTQIGGPSGPIMPSRLTP